MTRESEVIAFARCTIRTSTMRAFLCSFCVTFLSLSTGFVSWATSANRCRSNFVLSKPSSDDEGLQAELEQRAVEFERERLEKQNTQAFLKRKPIKLPYEDARKWVQANLGCDTREEFYDLVANGNLRTPYIPKNPQDYYESRNEWISWEHFLHGLFDSRSPSGVKPASGIFD